MVQDQLRRRFNEAPRLYDQARPRYPARLYDDLIALTGIPAGGRILEIGCGTGIATEPLAQRGYQITAVELGEDLAAFAAEKLAPYSNVEVICATFESWIPPPALYDVVMSATAFHWIDPAIRCSKSAAVLRPGGALAVFGYTHVAGGDAAFFADVQACYERFMPGTEPGITLTNADDMDSPTATEAEASGLFESPQIVRYMHEESYTTATYLDVLDTYSGHRDLEAGLRSSLYDCIADMIDTRFGGRIVKQYMTELVVARKPLG